MVRVSFAVYLLLGVCLFVSPPAAASGAVSINVIGSHCKLQIAQNFRKILSGRDQGDYYGRVRQRFLQRAAAILPAVTALLSQRRWSKWVSRYPLGWSPRVQCRREHCADLERAHFPARIRLPHLFRKGSGRYVHTVTVGFLQRPTFAQVMALKRDLQTVIDRYTPAPTALVTRQAAPMAISGAKFHADVTLPERLDATALAHFQRQKGVIAQRLRRRIQKVIAGVRTPALHDLRVPHRLKPVVTFLSVGELRVKLSLAVALHVAPDAISALQTRLRQQLTP